MHLSHFVRGGIAFSLSLIIAAAVWAGETVSFSRLLDSAVAADPETTALREELEVARGGVVRAGTLANPVLETEIATGRLTGSPDEGRYGVGISQELPLWGKRGGRQAVAAARVREAEAKLAARKRAVASELTTRYYTLVLSRERRRIAGSAAELARTLREVAEARFAEGDVPEYELNLAKGEEGAAAIRSREAEREETAARRNLLLLAGLPEETRFPAEAPERPAPSEEELVTAALARRPEAVVSEAESTRAEAELALAKRVHLPDLTAGLSVQRELSATEIAGRSFREGATLVGVKLSMPIPLFDRNAGGIREATARVQGAEERKRLLKGRIEREVRAASRELASASKSLAYFDGTVLPPMRENVAVMQEAYRLGEIGISAVIQEQRKLTDSLDVRHVVVKAVREAEEKLEQAAALPLLGEGGTE